MLIVNGMNKYLEGRFKVGENSEGGEIGVIFFDCFIKIKGIIDLGFGFSLNIKVIVGVIIKIGGVLKGFVCSFG